MRKYLWPIIIVLVLVVGVIIGIVLVKRSQDIRKKASTPSGTTTVSLSPSSGSYNVGASETVGVYFDSSGVAISGVATRISYPNDSSSPEVSISSITPSQNLTSSGEWSCPVKTTTAGSAGLSYIDVSCINTSTTGFISTGNTLLATFILTFEKVPVSGSVNLVFDPVQSIITSKTDGSDILLTPQNSASFVVLTSGGGTNSGATSTPTPTPTPTATPASGGSTASPTQTPTATPGSRSTATPISISATPKTLPDSGFGFPVVIGVGLGIILFVSSFILIL